MNQKNTMQLIMFIACSCIANITVSQIFWVTSNANSGPGTVRQIITNLNSSGDPSNTINVSLAGNVEVMLESKLPKITKPVMLNGQDVLSPSQLTLNGNNIVDIGLELATDNNIGNLYEVNNITITNIKGESAIGIITDVSRLVINNCTITDVTADNQSGSEGSSDSGSEYSVAIGIEIKQPNIPPTGSIFNTIVSGVTNNNVNGNAYGILNQLEEVNNCTIQNIICGENKTSNQDTVIAAGILSVSKNSTSLINNTISDVSSSDSSLYNGSGSQETNSFSTAYGIRFKSTEITCHSNTISNITSGNADTSLAEGISLSEESTSYFRCRSNTISYITSGEATISSIANGILINLLPDTICSLNNISHLISKKGNTSAVTGIKAVQSSAIFFFRQNTIFDIDNTLTENATATGIFMEKIISQNSIMENTITNLIASQEATGICIDSHEANSINENIINQLTAESAFGIKIKSSNNAITEDNNIENIKATLTSAYGIFLGPEEQNNNLILNNNIKHVTGPQGFGITVLNENSNRNALLTNLICDITTKAIDIEPPTDAACKLLHATLLSNGNLQIQGILDNMMSTDQELQLQFFVNNCNTIPQTPVYIGDLFLDPIGTTTPFNLILTPLVPIKIDQYITMTATKNTGIPLDSFNTSEVSNARRVRISSTHSGGVCALVCSSGSDDGSCCIINR